MSENVKPKLIRKHMFEHELRDEFEKKVNIADARLRNSPIKMDDLDPLVVKKLQNIANPGATAYDDAELRNRIIQLENDHTTVSDTFSKGRDKVGLSLLDGDLTKAYNNAGKVPGILTDKADKSYVDSNFRNNGTKITEGDFDSTFEKKINDLVSDVNRIDATFSAAVPTVSKLSSMQGDIDSLKSAKADQSYVSSNYRSNSQAITLSDVDATIAGSINKIPTMEALLKSKAEYGDVEKNYRKKADSIQMSDFDGSLQTILNRSIAASEGTAKLCEQVFDEKFNKDGRKWCYTAFGTTEVGESSGKGGDYLNYINPYNFALGITNIAGTTGSTGAITHTAALNYLYSRAEDNLSKINSANAKTDNVNATLSNSLAAAVSRIAALETENNNQATLIKGYKTQVNDLAADIASIKTRLTALENKA